MHESFFFAFRPRGQLRRRVESGMQNFCLFRKSRAGFWGVIAESNNPIELHTVMLFQVL
jgi:hypothetical protein